MLDSSQSIIQLKEVLELNQCYYHKAKPQITVFDSTMMIKCCCNEFFSECRTVASELNEVLGIENLTIK